MSEETVLVGEPVLEGPMSEVDRQVFLVRRATLMIAFVVLIATFAWSVRRIVGMEPDAIREARNLVARRVDGHAVAVDKIQDAFMQSVSQNARAAIADSKGQVTPDSTTRMANMEGLYQLSKGIREGARIVVPEAKDIKPLTVFVSPLTGKAIPLNATADGRYDEAKVQEVLAKQEDISLLMGLIRARAEAEAPKDLSLAALMQAKAKADASNGGVR